MSLTLKEPYMSIIAILIKIKTFVRTISRRDSLDEYIRAGNPQSDVDVEQLVREFQTKQSYSMFY